MNPNTHNNYFPPSEPDDGKQPQGQPQQPYYGPPQMPAPQPPPYGQPQQPPSSKQSYANQLPEQQYGAQGQPGHHELYDFIMKPEPGKKPPRMSLLGNNTMAVRITILGLGVLVLIVAVGSFMTFLNRPKYSTTALVGIAQQQAELVRVAGIVATISQNQKILNSSFTIKLGLGSDEQQLVNYLAKNHTRLDTATLGAKLNKQTNARLNSAVASSTLDSTYIDIIQSQLGSYLHALKAAYTSNPGPNGQKLLSAEYKSASLLLTQTQQQ